MVQAVERLRLRQVGERNTGRRRAGREVPERAIERIAGGARRHRLLQRCAVEAVGDVAPIAALRALAVSPARVGHAFAAPGSGRRRVRR
jgi:hypothetical protein